MPRVDAITGDLAALDVDVVVNAANEHLSHGGGVAAALASAGGPAVQDESDAWVAEHGPVEEGQAAVTTGGNLPARWIVHVVGPRHRGDGSDAAKLTAAVTAALDAADDLGVTSVALPAISAGIFGYPVADATRVIAAACQSWATAHPDEDLEILLVGYDDRTAAAFRDGLDAVGTPPTD